MPPKRAASQETHEAVNKRYREAIDDVAQEKLQKVREQAAAWLREHP